MQRASGQRLSFRERGDETETREEACGASGDTIMRLRLRTAEPKNLPKTKT